MTQLGDLVEITGGGTPSKKVSEYWSGDIPWASVKDFKGFELEKTQERISQEGLDNSASNLIPAGSIIVPTRMAVGKVAINVVDLAINQDLKALTIRDPKRVDRDYLFRTILNSADYLERRGKGATVKGITLDVLREMEIPLPPLKEQKRIAAILDKADAIRRKRQQAIYLTDQLLRAVFLELFGDPVTNPKGWESIPLHEVADIRSGITKGRKTRDKVLSEIPYMRVANVQDAHITLDDVATIAVTKEEQERYKLLKNDILLTEGGDPDKLGRGAVWKGEVDPCIHQNHIFCVRIKDNKGFTPYYLSTLIGSKYGKRYFLREAKQTTGIATINKSQLKEFPVLVVPKKLQNKFAEYLVIFESYKTNYEALLNQQINLFNSLVQQAFKGELS